jgi:uncharacterized protein YkwD
VQESANRKFFVLVGIFLALSILASTLIYALAINNQSDQNTGSDSFGYGSGGIQVEVDSLEVSDIDINQLWSDTNSQRVKSGLRLLTLNPRLDQSAQAKCADMVGKDYWSHNDPSGKPPWHFITSAGVPRLHLGENLGTGFDNAATVINAWMLSPEHKANILDPRFTDVGFGVCKSEAFVGVGGQSALIVVQHFAQL